MTRRGARAASVLAGLAFAAGCGAGDGGAPTSSNPTGSASACGGFDPRVGKTKVYVGPAATPPEYDPQSDFVSHATLTLDVEEGRPAPLTLPAGRWWLLSSWTVDITLNGCAASTITQVTPNP